MICAGKLFTVNRHQLVPTGPNDSLSMKYENVRIFVLIMSLNTFYYNMKVLIVNYYYIL